jgi:PIN domain nuclease of toxin-antitoxin system
VKLLLDTHTLLWWWKNDSRLSKKALNAIKSDANVVLVSAVSAWEIATKHRIGKLAGVEYAITNFAELIAADNFAHLPITYQHALTAGTFAAEHRDPFDRMLAAQAIIEDATLVTDDAAISEFRAKTLW